MPSDVTTSGLLALGGVALGIGGTLLAERIGYGRERSDALDDRLYQERSATYIDFLEAAHECAHEIGKLARHDEHGDPNHALPTSAERVAIAYGVDAFVARHVRAVEIVGPESVEKAAKAVLVALYKFRNRLQKAIAEDDPVVYTDKKGSRYMVLLAPYREAREAFVEAAKTELGRLSRLRRNRLVLIAAPLRASHSGMAESDGPQMDTHSGKRGHFAWTL
jgi:hypothetical protein